MLLLAWAPAAPALDLAEYPDLAQYIDEVAQRHGFSRAGLVELFSAVRVQTSAVQAMERPREALPWYEYKKAFLDEPHVRDGARFWHKHAPTLAQVEQRYGVPPEIILGILGVETHYGRNKGEYRVIDALTTLSLKHVPRADFFRSELTEFLLLCRELKRDPLTIRGSYAGAIGMPQFIPSSYRRYAVAFEGNARANLIDNPADAIASVGNFLKRHGWQAGAPVSDAARLEGTLYFWIEKLGTKPSLTVQDLIGYGIYPARHTEAETRAALIGFEGEAGPFYRVGYNNFYVITRYNRSKRYAMAVIELAELIRNRYEETP